MKKLKIMLMTVLLVEGLSAYEDRDEPNLEGNGTSILQEVDKNEDNRISLEEASGGMKENFSEHDLDGNGFIEGDELNTLPKDRNRVEHSDDNFHKRVLERHDKDGDAKISRAEAGGGMKRNFKKHDLNGDGFIEGDELDTLPRHKRGEHDKHFNDRR